MKILGATVLPWSLHILNHATDRAVVFFCRTNIAPVADADENRYTKHKLGSPHGWTFSALPQAKDGGSRRSLRVLRIVQCDKKKKEKGTTRKKSNCNLTEKH